MDTNARVQALAARIIRAHQNREPFDIPAGEAPASIDEAYSVQDIVAEVLWTQAGDAIRAWKTGGPYAEATPVAAPIRSRSFSVAPSRCRGRILTCPVSRPTLRTAWRTICRRARPLAF